MGAFHQPRPTIFIQLTQTELSFLALFFSGAYMRLFSEYVFHGAWLAHESAGR